ncbi:MAG: peptide chain release factor N(5)-glutamine methyltransferase [Chloroflexi bacterium]|nr:peptide chain release factor N(5)-glutamine methyltransferase [Chloroflexota bacterium]
MTQHNTVPDRKHSAGTIAGPAIPFHEDAVTVAIALREAKALLAGAIDVSPGRIVDLEETHREISIEAAVLLGNVLGLSRTQLYSYPSYLLSDRHKSQYQDLLARRLRGEPVAYITGHREFFALDLVVAPRVLIPRPETELLVDAAISEAHRLGVPALRVADIGTGSGAIAISLAKHLPGAHLYATDVSAPALTVALANCQRLDVSEKVTLLQGDLLAPLPEQVHIIVANLPYIAPEQLTDLPAEVAHFEPRLALLAADGGLALYRQLFAAAPPFLRSGGVMIVEIDPAQATAIEEMASGCLPVETVRVDKDYAGYDRVVVVRTKLDY